MNQSSMRREMWSITFERSPALIMSCFCSSMTGRGGDTGDTECAIADITSGGSWRGSVGLEAASLEESGESTSLTSQTD